MRVQANTIYVIPPNTFMSLVDGHLVVSSRSSTALGNYAIDYFMNSLASIYRNKSIGVVLSGTATDGTLGLRAIKANGGITFAQDDSAKFPGMPTSAYESGYADFKLPPAQIANELRLLTKVPYAVLPDEKFTRAAEHELKEKVKVLKSILEFVGNKFGVDFFLQYKRASVYRRVVRRMILNKFDQLEDYHSFIENNSKEVDALYGDFLINVTNFFRDPDFFKHLSKTVFPTILTNKKSTDPVRIWVAGCATGEEAYSIAICAMEFCAEKNITTPISIFASDLDAQAIEKARLGVYPLMALHSLSPARLKQYFKKIDGNYQIAKSAREICIFSQHNLLKDPPFSRMDLISCQNVLIYMEATPQRRILETFHYALKPTGFLFLGKSETLGTASDLFRSLSKNVRSFTKKNIVSPPLQFMRYAGVSRSEKERSIGERPAIEIEKELSKELLSRYVCPSVVLDQNFNIVRFYGITTPYLGPSLGKASFNVLKMIHEDLLVDIRSLLEEARSTGRTATKDGITTVAKKMRREISIDIIPKKVSGETFYLIVFREDRMITDNAGKNKKATKSRKSSREIIAKLEDELQRSRETIRTTNEEYETTYEELLVNSEEISSSNEELQSVNEELETSKEELQSANEELTTINEELGKRNAELKESHTYAEAIIQTMHSPLLVLTSNLQVRMANAAFYKTFKLYQDSTEGNFIFDLDEGSWDIPALRDELNNILSKKSKFKEFSLTHNFKGIGEMVLDVHAYRLVNEANAKETLLLLAFNNVGDLLKSNRELKKVNDQLEQFAFISSHDLQEPLRKITTYSNMLSAPEANLNDHSRKYASKIISSSKRMSKLLQDLLSFSSLLKHNNARKVNIDLNLIIQNVLEDFELVVEKLAAEISVTTLPTIMGEPTQINQMFHNLIGNALKFSKDQPVIDITSRSVTTDERELISGLDESKSYVAIAVKDNGIGFDQKFAQKMFVLFQRLGDKPEVEGTGIGLAISKKIAEDHGGAIQAKGIEGKGATFTVILPVN